MMRNIFQGKAGEKIVDAREAFSMKAGEFVDAGKAFSPKNISRKSGRILLMQWKHFLKVGDFVDAGEAFS